jgi:hypothetical protein
MEPPENPGKKTGTVHLAGRCFSGVSEQEVIFMSTFKTIAIAAALLAGASTLASAQMSGNSNTGTNAAASGGSGTHATAPRTGSAASTQKILKNKNGYQRQ